MNWWNVYLSHISYYYMLAQHCKKTWQSLKWNKNYFQVPEKLRLYSLATEAAVIATTAVGSIAAAVTGVWKKQNKNKMILLFINETISNWPTYKSNNKVNKGDGEKYALVLHCGAKTVMDGATALWKLIILGHIICPFILYFPA